MAHSKESKTKCLPDMTTSNVLSYSFPQVAHFPIRLLSICDFVHAKLLRRAFVYGLLSNRAFLGNGAALDADLSVALQQSELHLLHIIH